MRRLLILFAVVMAGVLVPQANANVSLDFGIPASNGGTFSWAGAGHDLVASNIGVANVTGESTPLNDGTTLSITGGKLNAISGPGTFDGTNVNFGAGTPTSITIVGNIGSGTETLLSGQVTGAKLEPFLGSVVLDVTGFTNTVASDLAVFFGVPTSPWAGAFHIDLTLPSGVALGHSFSGAHAGSGDLVTSTPEPSSMVLAGLGALGLIGFGIRRRRAD